MLLMVNPGPGLMLCWTLQPLCKKPDLMDSLDQSVSSVFVASELMVWSSLPRLEEGR